MLCRVSAVCLSPAERLEWIGDLSRVPWELGSQHGYKIRKKGKGLGKREEMRRRHEIIIKDA